LRGDFAVSTVFLSSDDFFFVGALLRFEQTPPEAFIPRHDDKNKDSPTCVRSPWYL